MSIRKLDKDTLNRIMSNKSIDNVNEETIDFNDNYNLDETEISQEELDALYELGLKEIENLKVSLVVTQLDVISSCFSPVFEISEPIKEYFKYMLFLCEEIFPKLLKGDIDDIINISSGEAEGTEEALHSMRENIYKILKSKNQQ